MSSANYGLPLLEHFVNGSTVRNPRSEIRAESVIVAVALHTRSRLQNWLPLQKATTLGLDPKPVRLVVDAGVPVGNLATRESFSPDFEARMHLWALRPRLRHACPAERHRSAVPSMRFFGNLLMWGASADLVGMGANDHGTSATSCAA